MNCVDAESWWGELAAGTAPPDVQNDLKAHAVACADCRRERDAYGRLESLLRARLAGPVAPPLSPRSLAPSVGRGIRAWDRRRRTLFWASAAAAAIVAAVLTARFHPASSDHGPRPPSLVVGPRPQQPAAVLTRGGAPERVVPLDAATLRRMADRACIEATLARPVELPSPRLLVVAQDSSGVSKPRVSGGTWTAPEGRSPDRPQPTLIVIALSE